MEEGNLEPNFSVHDFMIWLWLPYILLYLRWSRRKLLVYSRVPEEIFQSWNLPFTHSRKTEPVEQSV